MVHTVGRFGAFCIHMGESIGRFALFVMHTGRAVIGNFLNRKRLLAQIEAVGIDSLGIIILTGIFSGMVFALQSYVGFQRVGGEQFIGAVVALCMIRELGPVLTGLMVTGRAGSAMAAELGTMRVTEQIDALTTLRINPLHYLVVPRVLSSIIALPLLSCFAMVFGIIGGYVVCIYVLGLNAEDYINNIKTYVELSDIVGGLAKSALFGVILSIIGCYKGYIARGGARGVGAATTQSVVVSSVLILITNYLVTKLLEQL